MIRPGWAKAQNTTVSSIITLTTVRPTYPSKRITWDRSNWVTVRPGSRTQPGDTEAQGPVDTASSSQEGEKSKYDNSAELDLFLDEPDYEDPGATIPRVIVWHNITSRTSFPRDLFCGPYDVHFGRLVANTVTFSGGKLVRAVEVTEVKPIRRPRFDRDGG